MATFKGLLATTFLFFSIILINFLQTSSLFIKPFSPALFRRFNRGCANTWWGWCDSLAKGLHGIQVKVTGDDLPVAENGIVILNHQRMTDIPVIFSLAKQKQRLGDLKWFVKDILKYVPGVGWGMLFLDCLFIKRDWLADQGRIHRVFANILNHAIPLWLVSFVEGTRFTPAKKIRSQKFAEAKGLPRLEHLLIPRTKGFVASVESLRGHVQAVYDLTIGYVGAPPTLWQWVKGEVKVVHLHVRRFPIHQLPQQGEAISQWLLNLFSEKDALLEHFYQKDVFPVGMAFSQGGSFNPKL